MNMLLFRRRLRTARRLRDDAGYVLAMSGLVLIPLLAATGFAVDVGSWYSTGIEVQRAADAAALAGVVWLPDFPKAQTVARETAARNGFPNTAPNTVTVEQVSGRQLRVTITSPGDQYFSQLFVDGMTVTRTALAEYILPVPLGSPRNFFGTGNLQSSPNYEGFWASINAYCTPREQGDAFAPRFQGNWITSTGVALCPSPNGPGPNDSGGSTSAPLNPDYNGVHTYEYVIEVPTGRTTTTQVMLFDPAKYSSGGAGDWANVAQDVTFTLRAPDSTPLDDSDNPLFNGCTGSGEPLPASEEFTWQEQPLGRGATIFGSSRWTRFCTIPSANAYSGRYLLSVQNRAGQGTGGNPGVINNYAVLASRGTNYSACDTRTLATCPGVYGKEWISIFAAANSDNASFYLAEIEAVHAGKKMLITLFDPGEGGNEIRIVDPNGNYANFTYRTRDGTYSGGPTSQLNVSGTGPPPGTQRSSSSRYNERFVEITVDLPADYATRYGSNTWWRIFYDFNTNVTDRTTWSVQVIGDPVRLVE